MARATQKSSKPTAQSTVDRKRSLAAKRGAATRARNRELLAAKRQQLRIHHKLVGGALIAAVLVFTFFGIKGQLDAFASTDVNNGSAFVGIANKCLDNAGDTLHNSNQIQLYKCNSTMAQKWAVGGTTIKAPNSNYCLDVSWGSKSEGAYVQLYTCNGTDAQKWSVAGNKLVNTVTGFCATVKNGATSDRTRIWMKKCADGSTSQTWKFGGPTSGVTTGGPTTGTTTGSTGSTSGSTSGSSTGGTTGGNTGSISTPPTSDSSTTNSGTSTNSLAGNIAQLPDFYNSKWLTWNDGYDKFPVTWQGYTNVLQVAPDANFIKGQSASGWTGENEINGLICDNGALTGCSQSSRGTRVAVKPGQTVTYSAYVWVTPSTVGAPNGGGFQFFMDVYGSANRIKELQGTNACDGCGRINVPYGSTGWTFVQMKFQVASSYKADGALGYSAGTSVTPTGIIPILQLNNWAVPSGYNDKATAYVRNTILTVQ